MEQIEASTVTKQFKRTFCEARLNELGKAVRFCLRERTVTPFRLVMGLINVMSTPKVETIADVQHAFNALCETDVQYKPFHNQLSKPQFPILMREVCCRVLDELACYVLQFGPDSPFAQFKHITIQDGTSYAIKPSLKGIWPGRFTATNPAAVELHVSLDLLTEMVNFATLTPDTDAEAQHLPGAQEVAGGLLLADRGYFKKQYLMDVDRAGGSFIVRGKANMNPTVRHAYRHDGTEIKAWQDKPLKELKHSLKRYDSVDMDVEYRCENETLRCRLIVSTRPDDATPRYLVTNSWARAILRGSARRCLPSALADRASVQGVEVVLERARLRHPQRKHRRRIYMGVVVRRYPQAILGSRDSTTEACRHVDAQSGHVCPSRSLRHPSCDA